MQTDWSAVGDQAGAGLWYLVAVALPTLFVALIAFLVLRAIVRMGRYRAVTVLGDEDYRAVHQALAEAERKTVGEILPVVVERSDPHPAAEWLAALSFVILGSSALLAWMPWRNPLAFLAAQVVLGVLGFGLARWLPDFKRLFVFENRATEVAKEQAFQEFYANDCTGPKPPPECCCSSVCSNTGW